VSSFDENKLKPDRFFFPYDGCCFKSNSRQTDSDDCTFIIGSENQYRITQSRQNEGGEKIQASTFVIEAFFFASGESQCTQLSLQANVMLISPPTPPPIPCWLVTIVKGTEMFGWLYNIIIRFPSFLHCPISNHHAPCRIIFWLAVNSWLIL